MADEAPKPIGLSELPETAAGDYRPLSIAAPPALLVAAASVATLFYPDPLAWIIPAAGVVLSLVAVRQTRRVDRPAAGYPLARASLVISLVVLAAAPTYYYTRLAWAKREARNYAEAWLDHLAGGRRYQAHQMTVGSRFRCPDDQPLSICYGDRNDSWQERFLSFTNTSAVSTLLRWGTAAQSRYEGTDVVRVQLRVDEFELHYRIEPEGDEESLDIRLRLLRIGDPQTGKMYWRIGVVGVSRVES
jgi:hypothetical protein